MCYFAEYVGAVGVESYVFVVGVAFEPFLFVDVSAVGDDGAAEIEGVVVLVEHYFGGVGVLQGVCSVFFLEGDYEGGYVGGGVVKAVFEGLELFGADEGFVALDVDDDVGSAGYFVGCFSDAVCAAFVVGGGHDRASAEGFDGVVYSFVVCGHPYVVEDF